MPRCYLCTDVFTVPRGALHLAHFPRAGTSMRINRTGVGLLHALRNGGVRRGPENAAFLELLSGLRLISEEAPAARPAVAALSEDPIARLTSVTLFLTTRCNLACRYCYAAGGERNRTLPVAAARRAVGFVMENAKANGVDVVPVGFHGGGEPTRAWELLRRVVDHARQVATAVGVRPVFGITTNGVLERDRCDWLIENGFEISLSMDGLGDVHDQLRPLRGTGSSFRRILRTLKRLGAGGAPHGVRITVSDANLAGVPDLVRFLCEDSACHTIQLEPLHLGGRAGTAGLRPPEISEFISLWTECREHASRHGRILRYSGLHYPGARSRFCRATGRSLCVTPDLHLTSCYEVLEDRDPRAAQFFFGRYRPDTDRLEIDPDILAAQQTLCVEHAPWCADCIAKHHCAGDCPAKRALESPGDDRYRCRLNRELLLRCIEMDLDRHGAASKMERRQAR
ncbi:MAG: radical SAM protein [Pseudomonadota bacterium]